MFTISHNLQLPSLVHYNIIMVQHITFEVGDIVQVVSSKSTWKGKQGIITKIYASRLYGVALIENKAVVRRFTTVGIIPSSLDDNIISTTDEIITTDVISKTVERITSLETKVGNIEKQLEVMISALVTIQQHLQPKD
jgi:hypothetical protein